MTYKDFISSKIVITLLALLLFFLGYLKFQQYRIHVAVENEKKQLENQQMALQQKNNELNQSLSYLNSESFKEKIAREQLNLKKDGEVVYTFSEKKNDSLTAVTDINAHKPNYQKWVSYFMD